MNKSTVQVYQEDRNTLHAWKRHYGLSNTADLLRAWIVAVRCHKQKEMYSRLPMPNSFKKAKALAGKKIDKSYRKNRCRQ